MKLTKNLYLQHPEVIEKNLVDLPNLVGHRYDKITVDIEELCDAFTEHGQAKVVLYITSVLRLRLNPKGK